MNKSTNLILSFILISTLLSAQHVVCGYDLVVDNMEKQYPGYRKSINKTFHQAKHNVPSLRNANTLYTIPVVVHVVWNEEDEKIDSSLILTQIEILNEDFQRLNDDAGNIRDVFADVVGSPMINFELKEIIYVQTESLYEVNLVTGELPDGVKVSSQGGSDARDVETNLNIWVCKIQALTIAGQFLGQIIGYAYPPNNLSNWPPEFMLPSPDFDGVVLDYRVIGKNNPVTIDPGTGEKIQFLKGRSAVHEIGHYLGLRHIWGDGLPGAQNSCGEDDGIEDTPNAGQASIFNCNVLQNTCSSNTTTDLPDMIENYMDYSEESCQNSFTLGQIALMRGVLELQRCALVNACVEVSTSQLQKVSLDIFPNPSNGLYHISTSQLDISTFDFVLYSTTGTSIPVSSQKNNIDLSEYPAGIYYLHARDETQFIQEKLVKF